jgi:cation diffusion facilitator family transporter
MRALALRLVSPHSHDHADSIDDSLMASRAGMRALAISLSGLLITAVVQLVIFSFSGSIGLLADTIHNFADAFTALPIGVALLVARRAPTKRYTYGFGRAEDLSGLAVVLVVAGSAVIAGWEALARIVHPENVTHLGWVATAGVIGFIGNELAARYRIRVGRRIGSAALVADGYHARTDGFTSLAVVIGAAGVGLGWRLADPVVGLVITAAILVVLRSAARDVYRRLMDAVDPTLSDQVERSARSIDGVLRVDNVRIRWVGHELRAELNVTVDRSIPVHEAHDIAELVRHELLHHVHRLTDATIHTDPGLGATPDPHTLTAHHYNP